MERVYVGKVGGDFIGVYVEVKGREILLIAEFYENATAVPLTAEEAEELAALLQHAVEEVREREEAT